MSIESHNLQEQYIALGAEGAAVIVPGGDAFWRSLGTANDRSGADDPNSRIVMSFTYEGDWSQWEMHPAGDEVVYVLSGQVTFVLEIDGQPHDLVVEQNNYAIVPRGIWHTARVHAPSRMLFITPGEQTQHRDGRAGRFDQS